MSSVLSGQCGSKYHNAIVSVCFLRYESQLWPRLSLEFSVRRLPPQHSHTQQPTVKIKGSVLLSKEEPFLMLSLVFFRRLNSEVYNTQLPE